MAKELITRPVDDRIPPSITAARWDRRLPMKLPNGAKTAKQQKTIKEKKIIIAFKTLLQP